MMDSREARDIFGRLCAHWPQLGGELDDPLARVRAEDWCSLIARMKPEAARLVCSDLILGWQGQWPPKIGDWQEAARRRAVLEETVRPKAIEPGSIAAREVYIAKAAEGRRLLGDKERTARVEPKPPRSGPTLRQRAARADKARNELEYGGLRYEDVYDQEGRVNAELEAEAEAMLARLQARGLA